MLAKKVPVPPCKPRYLLSTAPYSLPIEMFVTGSTRSKHTRLCHTPAGTHGNDGMICNSLASAAWSTCLWSVSRRCPRAYIMLVISP